MSESSSAAEASVAVYKKFIGAKRWNAVDDAEGMATSVFEEICNVYGEENAVQMVGACCVIFRPQQQQQLVHCTYYYVYTWYSVVPYIVVVEFMRNMVCARYSLHVYSYPPY